LDSCANKAGLAISTTETQVTSINTTPAAPVTLTGEPLEFMEDLTHLGSFFSKDNGTKKNPSKQDWVKPTVLRM